MCHAKLIKFIIKLYKDHNTLWVTQAAHQKAESLRAASILKLQRGQQQLYLHYKVCWILNHMVSASSFFHNPVLVVHTTTSTISTKNSFLYFIQFSPPYSILTCYLSQNHPYNLHKHSIPLYLRDFSPPYFGYNHIHNLQDHPHNPGR